MYDERQTDIIGKYLLNCETVKIDNNRFFFKLKVIFVGISSNIWEIFQFF